MAKLSPTKEEPVNMDEKLMQPAAIITSTLLQQRTIRDYNFDKQPDLAAAIFIQAYSALEHEIKKYEHVVKSGTSADYLEELMKQILRGEIEP